MAYKTPAMTHDANGNAIQALRIGTIVNNSVTSSSQEVALPTDTKIIMVSSSTDCYINLGTVGGSVATTTGLYFPKGSDVWAIDLGVTHLRVIRDVSDGRITITQLY